MSELVPLPLFMSHPPVADPGIMMICAVPAVPVTSPGPCEVSMGLGGALVAAVCAQADPMVDIRPAAIANHRVVMGLPLCEASR